MNRVTERRSLATEIRLDSSSGPNTLVGYAAKYNTLSTDLGGFRETLAPGAFTNALRRPDDVRFCFNHDPSLVLGRTTSGTLRLSEDSVGLRFSVDLPDTSTGRDLLEMVRRRDISQCSFAFMTDDESWDDTDDPDDSDESMALRTVRDLHLLDVSAVAYPAYSDTNVNVDPVVAAMGRSLSFSQMFPSGVVPAEIRSRFPNLTQVRSTTVADRRRSLVNRIINL